VHPRSFTVPAPDEQQRTAVIVQGKEQSDVALAIPVPGASSGSYYDLDVANVILAMSLMSFLGLGQPAPAAELGAMTARSLESLTAYWWLPILPAAAIFLMCLCANLAGDGLRATLRGA